MHSVLPRGARPLSEHFGGEKNRIQMRLPKRDPIGYVSLSESANFGDTVRVSEEGSSLPTSSAAMNSDTGSPGRSHRHGGGTRCVFPRRVHPSPPPLPP